LTVYNKSLDGELPSLVIEYVDSLEGFCGWLVIDDIRYPLAAGGMRVQPGLSRGHLINMAQNMTMKMRVSGLPIAGAKCGIDYDPTAPGKKAAMARFMSAIKPYIQHCYSMGPDLNTSMDELEEIARDLGIPSVKMAIAESQGMELKNFLGRYDILAKKAFDDWTLGQIRAGYGVAVAAIAVLRHLDIEPGEATAAVQGFGTLAKAAIAVLQFHGVTIRAVAEAEKCICTSDSCKVLQDKSLLCCANKLLPDVDAKDELSIRNREAVFETECDVLVLAAIENAITQDNANTIKARSVVPGANLAVTPEAEELLFKRGIPCLPSFMAGCGGSLSMNGLFAPAQPPTPQAVLDYVFRAMTDMVGETLRISEERGISPGKAALLYCDGVERSGRPYKM
jgi:glutamate dehydrogenase (NAD(P)+)